MVSSVGKMLRNVASGKIMCLPLAAVALRRAERQAGASSLFYLPKTVPLGGQAQLGGSVLFQGQDFREPKLSREERKTGKMFIFSRRSDSKQEDL